MGGLGLLSGGVGGVDAEGGESRVGEANTLLLLYELVLMGLAKWTIFVVVRCAYPGVVVAVLVQSVVFALPAV